MRYALYVPESGHWFEGGYTSASACLKLARSRWRRTFNRRLPNGSRVVAVD